MTKLTDEQQRAYDRFIRARNAVSLGQYRKYNKGTWEPTSDVLCTFDQEGMNHPLFIENDRWKEYKEASSEWWAVEPRFRDEERLRSSRGDYGKADNWDVRASHSLKRIDL
jgi:hypothetical protein